MVREAQEGEEKAKDIIITELQVQQEQVSERLKMRKFKKNKTQSQKYFNGKSDFNYCYTEGDQPLNEENSL